MDLMKKVMAMLSKKPRDGVASKKDHIYLDMKLRAFSIDASLFKETPKNGILAFAMETALPDGEAYFLLVVAEGTTSLYFSNGGGIIGAEGHESVRAASSRLLNLLSGAYKGEFEPWQGLAVPVAGMTRLYFMTADGVFSQERSEVIYGEQKSNLSHVFYAAHDVIAAIRMINQN